MDKADIIIEDGKIVQVGAELEVPSGNCTLHVCKKKRIIYMLHQCVTVYVTTRFTTTVCFNYSAINKKIL